MRVRFRSLLWTIVFACTLGAGGPALAALTEVGPPIDPHGYPQYYGDATGLRLELCPASDPRCISAPVDPNDPASVALGVGDESFWWSAGADAVGDGMDGLLDMALEAAFSGTGVPADGNQIAFGRIRVRVDVPVPGTYTVTHPYGQIVFENVTVADGINYTEDIGSMNVLTPAVGFQGALQAKVGPFLTWPDFADPNVPGNEVLQVPVLDPVTQLPTGQIIQHVGDLNTPHVVTGGTFIPSGETLPVNYFRVEGPDGIVAETDLFAITGRVLPEPPPAATTHVFPPPPAQNLFAVGPVNREAPFVVPTTGTVTGALVPSYPVGYPLWYQENAGTVENPAGGLMLTLCPPLDVDPMCISAEIDPNDPAAVALNTGEEAFWWSGEAFINADSTDLEGNLPVGLDGQVTLALEAAFGGAGGVADGQQISFGRVRIRVDVTEPGTYTITHPYGVEVFENVTVLDGINFTRDLGIINPLDPDGAFVGTLYSNIGPKVLTWPNYLTEPSLKVNGAQYVGDPAVEHVVTGSTFIPQGEALPANYFRIQGPNGIDVKTSLFVVTGKLFLTPVPRVGVAAGGNWYLDTNDNGTWEQGLDTQLLFGSATDQPLMGDWDGDGVSTPGVKRDNTYYLRNSNTSGVADVSFIYGDPADTPVVGDWDGDGIDTIGIKRGNIYYLRNSNTSGVADETFVYGGAGDVPVAGDWDGDNVDTIGIKRENAYYLRNSNTDGVADLVFVYGLSADTPVVGDWNADGVDTIGVYRSETGAFYLRNSNDSGVADVSVEFGVTGATPFAGRW